MIPFFIAHSKLFPTENKPKYCWQFYFLKENSFLLIDEPTNHLDAHGREIIRNYLNQKSGFILISHDRAFVDGCVDHILSINNTNIEIQKEISLLGL